jgi:hypothetical protein
MPGQSRAALGAEILAVSVGCVAYTVWSLFHALRRELPAVFADFAVRWPGPGATWVLSIGAGIGLLASQAAACYRWLSRWRAPGVLDQGIPPASTLAGCWAVCAYAYHLLRDSDHNLQ